MKLPKEKAGHRQAGFQLFAIHTIIPIIIIRNSFAIIDIFAIFGCWEESDCSRFVAEIVDAVEKIVFR